MYWFPDGDSIVREGEIRKDIEDRPTAPGTWLTINRRRQEETERVRTKKARREQSSRRGAFVPLRNYHLPLSTEVVAVFDSTERAVEE